MLMWSLIIFIRKKRYFARRNQKKEALSLERKADKIRRSLGGIMEMGGKPDLLFIIDTNRESLALQEAKKLGVPVVAILDSNSDPVGIDFPIPGNDDAVRSIKLILKSLTDNIISGKAQRG